MDVRDYIAANAAEFSQALRDWLSIPSVSAGPARPGDVRRSAEWLAVAVGLDADRIHAPNEYVDPSPLLRGAQSIAYLWEELAGAGVSA